MKKRLYLFWLLAFAIVEPVAARHVVVIADESKPIAEREAILVLPGFGSKLHGSRAQKKYFAHKGYDLFIPDYISRKSMARTLENVDRFINKHRLKNYKKVHVFSYIVGSWTINNWIAKNPENNIATIVYDRSPLQERAPFVLTHDRPILMKLLAGPILKEFSKTPYPPIEKKAIRTGIIIESKATKAIRRHKKTTLSMGPVGWGREQFAQPHDDHFYTWLDHDEMYTRFDVIGEEVFTFIKTGRFSDKARREPFPNDPFTRFNVAQ